MTVMTEAENAAALMRLDVKGEFKAMQDQIEDLQNDGMKLRDEIAALKAKQDVPYVGQELWVVPENALSWSDTSPPWRVEAVGRDWIVYRHENLSPEIAELV